MPVPTREDAVPRLPIVGVLGSGREAHADRAEPLGELIASEGFHLLTGGGAGAMEAVSRAYASVADRRGMIVGVLPGDPITGEAPAGYPNRWVELAIRTHLPFRGERGEDPQSRNHINVLSADALVALPGGPGTASEVRLALRYGKPVVAHVARREEFPGLPAEVEVESELAGVRAFLRRVLAGGA